jgi:hypothetical protein
VPAVKKNKTIEVRWISKNEFRKVLDTKAKRVLNVTADQFITRWKAGRYRKLDTDTCPGVIELAILAPLPRLKSGRKNSKRGSR